MATVAPIERLPVFDPYHELSDNVRGKFFIGGRWRDPRSAARVSLVSPETEEAFLDLPDGAPGDMDDAVAAASSAFEAGPWPRMPVTERVKYMIALNAELLQRKDLFSRTWTAQMGIPQSLANMLISDGFNSYEFFIGLAPSYPWEEARPTRFGRSLVRQEPVGVCALITPWNHPFGMLCFKTAPALLAGCTMVIKPSPETPLEALIYAEAAAAAGIPDGVINVVPAGRETGDYLIRQSEVQKVSFTGSSVTGRHIASVCGARMARSSMELGGKSAVIILDDADMGIVMETLARWCMTNSGQGCLLLSRILVSRHRIDDVSHSYAQMVKGLILGSPWAQETQLGPLASKRQMERVLGYIQSGKDEGANLLAGGGRSRDRQRGYFVEPTVFSNVSNTMRIAQEEIFGPVVCFIPYEDEDDAVRIANESDYGLNGAVFSKDEDRAFQVAKRIRSGTVGVNTANADMAVPFGGLKQSGFGREHGKEALTGFLETKAYFFRH